MTPWPQEAIPAGCKIFLENLFAEESATICYSVYRVVDCKVFFVFFFGSPTRSVAKRDRAALIGIGLAETLWAC